MSVVDSSLRDVVSPCRPPLNAQKYSRSRRYFFIDDGTLHFSSRPMSHDPVKNRRSTERLSVTVTGGIPPIFSRFEQVTSLFSKSTNFSTRSTLFVVVKVAQLWYIHCARTIWVCQSTPVLFFSQLDIFVQTSLITKFIFRKNRLTKLYPRFLSKSLLKESECSN